MRSVRIVSKYFLLLLVVLCTLNCAVTEKRYKVLRIFFDGVPDPNQVKEETVPGETTEAGPKQRKDIVRAPMKSRHPDFAARDCGKCHNQASANYLNTKKDKICFSCHDRGAFQGKYFHGPMAVSDCLACHLPHESQYLSLLKAESAVMCFECHMREDVSANPVHEDVDLDKGMCTQCHSPHASQDRFFLKI